MECQNSLAVVTPKDKKLNAEAQVKPSKRASFQLDAASDSERSQSPVLKKRRVKAVIVSDDDCAETGLLIHTFLHARVHGSEGIASI